MSEFRLTHVSELSEFRIAVHKSDGFLYHERSITIQQWNHLMEVYEQEEIGSNFFLTAKQADAWVCHEVTKVLEGRGMMVYS